ncbi:ATP-grasp domain-containing protein [Paractinoplanes rhizophilus]|uniref:ATP-grasp domain-containing protein n=1 Tax=Paractinoplanes rhizophilus TaxID=1416877 RepID=A0ABW2I5N6_9ACTN
MAFMLVLFPSDVLRPRRCDEHFAAEADAARSAGHQVAVVDHDALASGAAEQAVSRVPSDAVAVYRGWMLDSQAYEGFAAALRRRGVRLLTTPEQYRRAHELPGWYAALAAFTPASAWTVGTDRSAFDTARESLGAGAGVLRDYTKSMKHHWDEAVYIPDLTNGPAAWSVAERLHELRGDDFAGGFVVRRFEQFTGAEVRTWWIHGTCRLITAHPDTPDESPPADADVVVPAGVAAAIATLRLPFVTVDLARRADGIWRIIELGDGQVSDRPSTTPPAALIAVLPTGDEPAGPAEPQPATPSMPPAEFALSVSDVFVLGNRGIVAAGPDTGAEFRSGGEVQIWNGDELRGRSTAFVELHSRQGTIALLLTSAGTHVRPGDRITGPRR